MNQYEKYKDSGIPWIGKIPAHWEIRKLKYVLESELKYGAGEPGIEENKDAPRYIRITDIGEDGQLKDDTFKSLPYEKAKDYLLKEGDVLFAASGTVGKTFLFKGYVGKACYAGYLVRARVNNRLITSSFLYLFTKSVSYISWKNSIFTRSTIANIGASKYKMLPVPLPPLAEQKKIVAYLDQKTSQIDQIIQAKKRLCELLEEERKAIISQAVSKGLNPEVARKDSGIKWIGEIPAHWEVRKMKYISKIYGRIGFRGYTTRDIVKKGEGAIVISPSNIKENGLNLSDCSYLSWDKYYESPEIMIFEDDIILSKTGTIGKTAIIPKNHFKMTLNPQFVVFKEVQLFPKYLYYQTACDFFKHFLYSEKTGSTIPTISQEKIGNFSVLYPPRAEQEEISRYLDRKTRAIDAQLVAIKKQLELFKEYRITLISKVVTGEIKIN